MPPPTVVLTNKYPLRTQLMKTDSQWLDKFVKMEDKWKKDAEGWLEYMEVRKNERV